jgi:hypothetical protein
MLLQFKHRVASVVGRFPWQEKSSHVHQPGLTAPNRRRPNFTMHEML